MALKFETGKRQRARKFVLYGQPGVGKTTLAAAFPRPVILDTEGGSDELDVARGRYKDWLAFYGALNELVREDHAFQTVVVDSIDHAERMATEHTVRAAGKTSIEAFAYGKGHLQAAETLGKLFDVADQLIERGINVVLVGHARTVRVSPPDELDSFDRYEPDLSKHSVPRLREWADIVGFCTFDQRLVTGQDGRRKAVGGSERVCHLERSAAFDAKCRFDLPAKVPMDFESFASVVPAATKPVGKAAEARAAIARASSTSDVEKCRKALAGHHEAGRLTDEEHTELVDLLDARSASIEGEVSA